MSVLNDIESAVQKLTPEQLSEFRAWFAEFDQEQWDREFERDAAGGAFDALAARAILDCRDGRCTDL